MSEPIDILIVSDTHGRVDALDRLVKFRQSLLKEGDVLRLIFLGDGLSDLFACSQYHNIITYAVRGNCDFSTPFGPFGEDIPNENTVTVAGKKIFMAHGHTLGVKGSLAPLYRAAADVGADIALFGHTHSPYQEYIASERVRGLNSPLTVFNPGSLKDGLSFGNLSVSDSGFLLSHGKFEMK